MINNPREFKEQLNIVINSYELIMNKLLADIELIEKEEGKILEYIKDVHDNIEKIDDNSSITIGNKRLKMLNINVSEYNRFDNIYVLNII